jgi:hypothetical protein
LPASPRLPDFEVGVAVSDEHWQVRTIAVMLRHIKACDIGAMRAGLAIILILEARPWMTLWFSAKANRVAAV